MVSRVNVKAWAIALSSHSYPKLHLHPVRQGCLFGGGRRAVRLDQTEWDWAWSGAF